MKYTEAVKKVRETKQPNNYMMVRLDYDTKLVLPYDEGMEFMKSISKAEQIKETYGKPVVIQPIARDTLTITFLSRQEYERIKVAALLNISVSDLDEVEEQENQAA